MKHPQSRCVAAGRCVLCPDLMDGNVTFEAIYTPMWLCRDGMGGLAWPLFQERLAEAGLTSTEREEMLLKAQEVEATLRDSK